MNPELIIIDDVVGLNYAEGYLATREYIAYDSETTGLTKHDSVIGFSLCADEEKSFYIILQSWNPTLQILEPKPYLNEARSLLLAVSNKKLLMHNGVFDCMMAESYFKISLINSLHTDTMILAHLLDENRRVGLKELAKEYFGEDSINEQKEMKASILANGGLITKANYELYKADSQLIAKYGAKDALLTYKLFMELVPELYAQGLDKFFYEEESMPLLRGPTYELNTTGLQVDRDALLTLKKTLEAECLEAKAFIYQEISAHIKSRYPGTNKKNVFNIGASQQLSWLLFGKLGLEFSTLTKGGKTVAKSILGRLPYTMSQKRDFIGICERDKGSTLQPEATVNGKKIRAKLLKDPWGYITVDAKVLQKLAPKYKWIEKLLLYQRNLKLLSTYVEGIESRTQYGIIYPSFLQHGTKTGRYSSREPNFQNLPKNDKRIKQFLTARPGKVFVGADYSQLEPRVFAYYSKDEQLKSVFNGEDDFYSIIGIGVYSKPECTPRKDGEANAFGLMYPKLRDSTKVIALASVYGTTAWELAPKLGKSIDDTQQDIENYFEQFPKIKQMMTDAYDLVKKQGFVTNMFGRPRRIPDAMKLAKLYGNASHSELPYDARKLLNMAVNAPIQGTGGSIINRSAIKMHENVKTLGISAPLVSQVHDFLVYECDTQHAETISLLLQDAMENTVKLDGIRLEALPKVGRNLAEV